MSLNRDQFAVVLASLRSRFRAGEWVEGEPLTVADIANECGVSPTPVREALARLAGEGLVEDKRGRGYYARRIDGVELLDLYRVQRLFAREALSAGRCPRDGELGPHVVAPDAFLTAPAATWEGILEALILRVNSPLLAGQQRRLSDLLAPARGVEPLVLGETSADFEPLTSSLAVSDWRSAEAALEKLLLRRCAAVDELVARIRLGASRYKSRI